MEQKSLKFEDELLCRMLSDMKLAECMNLLGSVNDSVEPVLEEKIVSSKDIKEFSVSNVMSCSYCNVSFTDTTEQRTHFKLDWHRYNIKHAVLGVPSVTQEDFSNITDDVSSISGSESDSSDCDVADLEDVIEVKMSATGNQKSKHAKVFFESSDQVWSVYRCLLHGKKEIPSSQDLVTAAQNLFKKPKQWLIVMLGGGHFAACVFSNDKPILHKTFHCYTVRAKQGGSQSSNDNKYGNAKSAGASLRRYNEQALVQHVQTIMTSWREEISKCDICFYRAAGPYNRNVLFGGKSAPLDKTDSKLRCIPFPTRRATMKEVNRVYNMLSHVECHGSASEFKTKFPPSPDRRETANQKLILNSKYPLDKEANNDVQKKKKRSSPSKQPDYPYHSENQLPEVTEMISSEECDIIAVDAEINMGVLKEFEDTVKHRRRKKKLTSKQRARQEKELMDSELEEKRKKLVMAIKQDREGSVRELFSVLLSEQERANNAMDGEQDSDVQDGAKLTIEEWKAFFNSPFDCNSGDTLLHLAASQGRRNILDFLLRAGVDPTITNKRKAPPYNVSLDKETKAVFKTFVAENPGLVDLKKANIPEPLTEEQLKELEEKKKEKKKEKRSREKQRKKEFQEKTQEEKDKIRFLGLSDREKCALAAERRLVDTSVRNLGKAKPPVLQRCFECGIDITGKVPFEYGINRFCTVACLKKHRAKTNSFGVEI